MFRRQRESRCRGPQPHGAHAFQLRSRRVTKVRDLHIALLPVLVDRRQRRCRHPCFLRAKSYRDCRQAGQPDRKNGCRPGNPGAPISLDKRSWAMSSASSSLPVIFRPDGNLLLIVQDKRLKGVPSPFRTSPMISAPLMGSLYHLSSLLMTRQASDLIHRLHLEIFSEKSGMRNALQIPRKMLSGLQTCDFFTFIPLRQLNCRSAVSTRSASAGGLELSLPASARQLLGKSTGCQRRRAPP